MLFSCFSHEKRKMRQKMFFSLHPKVGQGFYSQKKHVFTGILNSCWKRCFHGNKNLNQRLGATPQNQIFALFFFVFTFFMQKMLKKHILTSVLHAQHPNAGKMYSRHSYQIGVCSPALPLQVSLKTSWNSYLVIDGSQAKCRFKRHLVSELSDKNYFNFTPKKLYKASRNFSEFEV